MCASCRHGEVARGRTAHAEAEQTTFEANTVALVQRLDVFFEIHDPTTLDRQGACARRAWCQRRTPLYLTQARICTPIVVVVVVIVGVSSSSQSSSSIL